MEPVNSWVALIVFFGMIWVAAFLSLQAVAYVGKKIRKAWTGRRSASPSPSGSPVLIITTFRVTPDRPEDPYMQRAKAEINRLTEEA